MPELPLHERPEVHERRWIVLGVMCLSLLMIVMAVSSLNVALPTIQGDLDTTDAVLQWIVDAYALVFAGLLLTAGALGDRFGRKGALLGGLVLFGAGAIVSGFAESAALVIVGRTIQGAGAAFVMPATLSMITVVFPPEERQRAIAVWVGFAGAGGALGPLLSGLLLEHYWWGAAFLVNVPVIAATFAAVALLAPRNRDDSATPLDPVGAGLSLVGLAALLFAIIEGPERGWTDGLVLAGAVVAVVGIGAFIVWERRTEHPMLPVELFADRRFSVGSAVVTTSFFVMFGFFFLFSLYLQYGRGYSALDAGVASLPFAGTMLVMAPRSAGIVNRLGSGRAMGLGFGLVGVGLVFYATVGVHSPYALLLVGMVLMAGGMAIVAAPATTSIMSAVPLSKAGVGSAVNDTTRELGGALGIAVFGSIVNSAYRSNVDLNGLGLSPDQLREAGESVGAARFVAADLGPGASSLVERAASAFTDAVNVAATVSAIIALVAAGVVVRGFTRAKEDEAFANAVAVEDELAFVEVAGPG